MNSTTVRFRRGDLHDQVVGLLQSAADNTRSGTRRVDIAESRRDCHQTEKSTPWAKGSSPEKLTVFVARRM